ncbi:MAG TPA: HEAT repeat domain-containing protein [Armatimonadota bacterium]|nr:HEAT repeat domain-containing protein [Armatimonadota bacterium]
MQSRVRLPENLAPGALYDALQAGGQAENRALVIELGRRAAREGWARRFLLDVGGGRVYLSPYSAVPALSELARVDHACVVGIMESGNPSASLVAGAALGRDPGRFEGTLVAAARRPEATVRLAAIAGLGEAAAGGSEGASEALAARLDDPDGNVRWSAAVHLGAARGTTCVERALSCLGEVIEGGDERLLSGAVFGLAKLWDVRKRESARLLLRAAKRGNVTRRAVALAMRRLPRRAAAGAAAVCLADADPEVRALCVEALAGWAVSSMPARRELARLAGDPEAAVRAAAAEVLARYDFPDAEAMVERLAADRSAVVRAAVAQGIGRGGREGREDVLERLAGDGVALVRTAAIRALAGRGREDLVRAACGDKEPSVRAAAAAALEPEGEDDVRLLLDLSRDRDGSVVRGAAEALGKAASAGSGPAWERLEELAAQAMAAGAAAEAMAATLDREVEAAGEVLSGWPIEAGTAAMLARMARASRKWQVAEIARTACRALETENGLGEALADVAVAFAAVGRDDMAGRLAWLAKGAEAGTGAEVAAAAARAPKMKSEAVSLLSGAGKEIARALGRREEGEGDRHLAGARAAIEAILAQETTGLEWALAGRVARRWRGVLERGLHRERSVLVRARLASGLVVCPRATLVVEVENVGSEAAREVAVAVSEGGPPARAPDLPAGESWEVELPWTAAEPGITVVRGRVQYRRGAGEGASEFEGRVKAVRAGPLGAVANPYVVGKPLAADSAMFFGRAAEIEYVARALAGGEGGSVVVLVGQRRTGKTSLLKRVAARLSYQYRPVFVDVQGILVSETGAFFEELARLALSGEGAAAMLGDGEAPAGGRGADMVREAAALCDRRLVLLLDEFDDLDAKVRSGRLSAEVFDQLRNLVQHSENVSLVLCGTHRLEELAGDHWSFLLNLATYRRVGCFEREEGEEVLRAPLQRLGIVCEDAAIARARRLTGGHPYFLQLVGYRLVEECVASGEAAVRVDTVERAAEEVVEQGDIHLRYLWEGAGEECRAVMLALSQAEAGLSERELEERLGWSATGVREAVETLLAWELVVGSGSRWVLRTGLLPRWLQRAQPTSGR